MIFEIAEAGPEFAGRRRPDQRASEGIETFVELGGTDAERAQVISNHRLIPELFADLAFCPYSRRVGRTEEFVGNHPRINAQPEREVSFNAPRSRKGRDPRRQGEVVIERVVQIPREHYLSRQSLRGVVGPPVKKIPEFRTHYPTQELDLNLVQLKVLALLDFLCIAECIGEGVVERSLI